MRARIAAVSTLLCAACVGQTGGQTVRFEVAAAGPADAVSGQPLAFTSGGFEVVLSSATLHVGGAYLVQTGSIPGAQVTGCYLTENGTYVAEETSPLDVDLVSPTPQAFPALGLGVTDPPPLIGQVWLTGGDVNEASDATPILVIAGTATQNGGASYPFTGSITIGSNHQTASSGPAGGDPICKERIVTPVRVTFTIEETGGLLLRIDPRLFFVNVDFSQLKQDPATGAYVFSDDPVAPDYQPAGYNLYKNLRSYAAYSFSWAPAL
jgi:hypothetical protein